MRDQRSCFGSASVEGGLYVAGGWCDGRVLQECERYDPRVGTWTNIATLNAPKVR